MNEPTIICPNCSSELKLTESLAAPLLAATRRDFEKRLAQKDADVAKRETAIRDREQALSRQQATLEEQIAQRVNDERGKIAAEEAKRARQVLQADLNQKARDLAGLQDVLKDRDAKLAEAQKTQAELLRKQRELDDAKRELDDAKRELDLTVEKRVQAGLAAPRTQAKQEAEEALGLKVAEKEQTIAAMQKQIEDLKRRAEQGSQQLQGEILELALEALLTTRFPRDLVEPVPKGDHGGDVLHRVCGPTGQACGTILWESKRTKNWSDNWLSKLREDQRAAKAEIAIIVSQALPKAVESFELLDGVWVAHPRVAVPVAVMLRQGLIDIAAARSAGEGQQSKMEMMYQYLTGPRFRQRVQAIVEAFSSMQDDLDRERKVITKQWAKREEQIERVMQATVGMYGDLQGIAGKTLQEIEGLDLPAIASE